MVILSFFDDALRKIKISYFSEVKEELSKVVWPKPKDVAKLTLVVLLISLIVGAYIGLLDLGFVKLLAVILK